jgi:gas vesicle protein
VLLRIDSGLGLRATMILDSGMGHKEVWEMRFLIGFAIGTLIGAFVALAVAPQPGSETRSIIVERVRQRRQRARDAMESVSGEES